MTPRFKERMKAAVGKGNFNEKALLKSYYKRVGRFLEEFSPYYNNILETLNDINSLRKKTPIGQNPITAEMCNDFFQAAEDNTKLTSLARMPSKKNLLCTTTSLI